MANTQNISVEVSAARRRVFTCPTEPQAAVENDILGCGQVFEAEPDEEGLVDCPVCGIWFKAEQGLRA